MDEQEQSESPNTRTTNILWGVQFLVAFLIAFLPIGFDKPSSLGLDFEFLLLMGVLYLAAYLINVMIFLSKRDWITAGVQFVVGAFVLLFSLMING